MNNDKTLIARYLENERRLILTGEITEELYITNVFIETSAGCAYTYSPQDKQKEGSVSFLVNLESRCQGLVDELNQKLAERGYKIEYKGVIS